MQAVFQFFEQVAASDVTVLIQGETGTGKDLAATSIHNASERRNAPLIVVDCGAISPTLLESELFGHERGAFTGADRGRAGVFESAQGGTIFLDEVGELGLELQPKLLRVLEQREVRRVGGANVIPIDVRILAATNRDLAEEVRAGRFRQDLYYRLMVARSRCRRCAAQADLPLLVRAILDAGSRGDAVRTARLPGRSTRTSGRQRPRGLRNYVSRCLAMQVRRTRDPRRVNEDTTRSTCIPLRSCASAGSRSSSAPTSRRS
jgi:transcriptional regulator with GAF, ATPase, and Fis domain